MSQDKKPSSDAYRPMDNYPGGATAAAEAQTQTAKDNYPGSPAPAVTMDNYPGSPSPVAPKDNYPGSPSPVTADDNYPGSPAPAVAAADSGSPEETK